MLPDRVSNPGPLTYESGTLPIACWPKCCLLREQKNNPFSNIIAHSLKTHPRKMPRATRRISAACSGVYDAFTSAYTTLSGIHSIAVKSEQK